MISKHGARLMSPDADAMLKQKLLPYATLVTPNIPEAEALTGLKIQAKSEMLGAAERLLDLGCKAVLIKGGHFSGEPVDLLVGCGAPRYLEGQRIETQNTHGTGCTYSAAITAELAKGETLERAVSTAKAFIQQAIESAPVFGAGYGPINFFADVDEAVNTSGRSDRPYRSRR
jgi:hydroxymethylpyrimidine/phosphomethylpyrimidine kinase